MIEISDHRNPVWLADHCDREDAFERALSAMIVQLMEDNRLLAVRPGAGDRDGAGAARPVARPAGCGGLANQSGQVPAGTQRSGAIRARGAAVAATTAMARGVTE